MIKKVKIIISGILATVMLFSLCTISSFAFEQSSLSFTVSADGYAILSDCDENTLGDVNIPSTVMIDGITYEVRFIGDKAFDSCYGITEINIPEGVTSIGNYAFRNCVSLREIYIPESLVMCQYDVFTGCGEITVHCYTSNYQFFSIFGISADLIIDIIDAETEEEEGSADDEPAGFIERLINGIKNMITEILRYFNVIAPDEDFEFSF